MCIRDSYNAMQHCYGQYTPQREAAALQQGYAVYICDQDKNMAEGGSVVALLGQVLVLVADVDGVALLGAGRRCV